MKANDKATAQLLSDLQKSLTTGTIQQRLDMMRKVTDLFLLGDVTYSTDQVKLFDDIYSELLSKLENDAREILAHRLAHADRAPPKTLRALAFDDDIRIAAPVLTHSAHLSDETLIENARTKSQLHLLAIAARKFLRLAITDILLERGNDAVVARTTCNATAELSEKGYDLIAARASASAELARQLAAGGSIPRPHYLKLVARASAQVRESLQKAHPQWRDEISAVVYEAAAHAREAGAKLSDAVRNAHQLVMSLHREGRIDEEQIAEFISHRRYEEAVSAISLLTHVPREIAEALLTDRRSEGLFIICKAARLSWATLQAFAALRDSISGETKPASYSQLDQSTYQTLRESTAAQVLRFHRMERASAAVMA